MQIAHLYLARLPGRINGVLRSISALAATQRELGHDVTIYLVDADGITQGIFGEMPVVRAPTPIRGGRRVLDDLAAGTPTVLHLHEVMRPQHARVARHAVGIDLPYVVTVHGGLAPDNLRRYGYKKRPYGSLIERHFLARAAAIVALTEVERSEVERFVGDRTPRVHVIPNSGNPTLLDGPGWNPDPTGRPQVVTLGRYDVRQKGLDVLADVARRLPEVDFVVYGEQCHNEPARTRDLLRMAPANYRLAPPVEDEAKFDLLRRAAAFAMPSRWEGLSMSLIEALSMGTPTAVSEYIGTGMRYPERDLGLVLPSAPTAAARRLGHFIDDSRRRVEVSERSRTFAREHFDPVAVATRMIDVYAEIVDLSATRP